MPLTARYNSTTNVVTIDSLWTSTEFTAARTAAGQPGSLFGNIEIVSFEVRVYRSQDVSSEGVVSGSPYFGTANTNIYANRFGPVITAAISLPANLLIDTQSVNVFRMEIEDTAGAASLLFDRGIPNAQNAGRTLNFPSNYWTEPICNGSWVIEVREQFRDLFVTTYTITRRVAFAMSGGATRTCAGMRLPTRPTVTATGGHQSIVLSWSGDTEATYWQYSIDNGVTWTRADARNATITGLTRNTQYTILVRGVNANGNGPAGRATASTSNQFSAIPAPTLILFSVGEVTATLNWSPTPGGPTVSYWQWSRDGITWNQIVGGESVRLFDVTNLTPDTAYTYHIRGVTAADVGGTAASVSFRTAALQSPPDEPVVGAPVVQRSLIGTPGGGSLKTTDRPPAFVVRGNRPSVVWDTSPFIVPPTNIYPGATLPGSEDNRGYADEFDPLPLKWSFFPAPTSNAAQASVRVLLDVYNPAGNTVDAGRRTLQLVNNVASFTSTATRVTTELAQFDVAGNTAGTQAASQGAPNGWGATPAGDSVGFARIGLRLSALDAGSPAQSSNTALMEFIPYQGLRLGDISTYNAGAGLVGFECHYYARGITATTQARNNDVAFYKWAIYRRNAAENERPVAGTIREAGQTLTASGAHWVPTGWSMGYRQHAWQTARGQVPLVRSGLRNPNTTRLRIAFPSAETTGLLPNGDYTIRLRVIDIYGNQVGPQSFNFSVNRAGGTTTPVSTTLPPGSDAQTIAVVPVPRVYTADGTLTTTANTGLADVTQGLIPGQSIGLSVNVVGTVPSRDDLRDVVGSEGEVVNILVVQRREFSRVSGGDVDRSPRIVSGRIFINTIGGSAGAFFPTFRVLNDDGGVDAIFFDHQLESGVEYQYRCVWINKFSNRSYSTWVPA